MNEGQEFQVHVLPPASDTPLGLMTWEWKMPDGRQVTTYHRLEGTVFAAHFHKGEDPAKNPERFKLLLGSMEVELLDRDGNYQKFTLDAGAGPVVLEIQPWVLHRMVALEDCWYIEYRPRYFDPNAPDTYSAREFPRQLPQLSALESPIATTAAPGR